MLNEASFGGRSDVSDEAEWDPAVVALRRQAEDWFRNAVNIDRTLADPEALVDATSALRTVSIPGYLGDYGIRRNVLESLMLRYPYQCKEADPYTFAVPRLSGTVKRALCEIHSGEYGVGRRSTHAELFVDALTALDDAAECAIYDSLPGVAFATSNLVSMGGLNRVRRGIVIGQLASFEMDSVVPNGVLADVCDRLGLPAATRRVFEVHVMADAEHEVIARQAFLVDYPIREPDQVDRVLFGIRAQAAIDSALAHHATRARWAGESALAKPWSVADVA